MNLHTKTVTTKSELDAVVDVLWAAMDGIEPSHSILFPTFGSTPSTKASAIADSKMRLWQAHSGNPTSHWIYVREGDAESGRIVGGCQWRVYEQNPFPNGQGKITAMWWPEGTGRLFASEVVSQCYGPRQAWMARPHVGLSLMCVLPELQRRGVGRKLMDWGVQKMDELDLESFIEASGPGRLLYEQYGFKPVAVVQVSMDKVDVEKSGGWEELEKTKLPIKYTAVWRPKQGVLHDGEPKETWTERFRLPFDGTYTQLI